LIPGDSIAPRGVYSSRCPVSDATAFLSCRSW
jgi:hypothetical protein